MFVDITEEGRGSGVGMIAESGAKVSCERGGAAGAQRMTASPRAAALWTNDVKGPEMCAGAAARVAPWTRPGGASLGNNQLFPRA